MSSVISARGVTRARLSFMISKIAFHSWNCSTNRLTFEAAILCFVLMRRR
jgi:hypothetical protein